MKVMLTSSLGGSSKVNGIRVPSVLIQRNGLLDNLKSIWTTDANVLIICADPSDYEKNDSVCACLRQHRTNATIRIIQQVPSKNCG